MAVPLARERVHRQAAGNPRERVDKLDRIEVAKTDQVKDFRDDVRQRAIGAEEIERVTERGRPVEELERRLIEVDEVVGGKQARLRLKSAGVFQRCDGEDREEDREQRVGKFHGRIIALVVGNAKIRFDTASYPAYNSRSSLHGAFV